MIKLLHISDLHFVQNADNYNMENILLREAGAVQSLPQGEKLLVVSGDFHNFSAGDYERAKKFLSALVTAMGLDMAEDVFLVPGNHDVGNDAALSRCFPDDHDLKRRNKAAVKMLRDGEAEYTEDRLKAFRPYCQFVRELGLYVSEPDPDYPARTHVRNWRGMLNLLHLNTALIADGSSKTNQRTDVDTAAAPETWEGTAWDHIPALAIGHNSFFDLEKTQRAALEAVFFHRNVSAYLCGDTHRVNSDPDTQVIPVESGLKGNRISIPNVICGKSTADGKDDYSDFGFYWHEWDCSRGYVTLRLQIWSREHPDRTVPQGDGEGYPMRCGSAHSLLSSPKKLDGSLHAPDYTEEQVASLFDNIVTQYPDVSSFGFIHQIHLFFLPHERDSSLLRRMQALLEGDIHVDSNGMPAKFSDACTASRDFAIYYCLGLYCKRQKKVDGKGGLSLKLLIDRYGPLFPSYPLHKEVEGWYYRRKVERVNKPESKQLYLQKAEACDRALLASLALEQNACVYISFASTVSKKLEFEYEQNCISLWTSQNDRLKDWTDAISYIPRIIEQYRAVWQTDSDYGKHHFLLGKLYLFAPNSHSISREERKKQIDRAREEFYAALDCDDSDDPDRTTRRREFDDYRQKCDLQEKLIGAEYAFIGAYKIRVDCDEQANLRQRLNKPNEDFQFCSKDSGIFVLADGVTRPHAEYRNPKLRHLAADCARELCRAVYDNLLLNQAKPLSPDQSMTEALRYGNRAIRELKEKKWETTVPNVSASYPPCCTMLLALLRSDTLYFYNCCDTIGYLIRNKIKMRFTEHYNWLSDRVGLTKQEVYRDLHNNPEHPAGFAIVDGDERFDRFIRIGQLKVASGDRIILSTDGLDVFLAATDGSTLCNMTAADMLQQSARFDQPPFRKYTDDKSVIIIDVL